MAYFQQAEHTSLVCGAKIFLRCWAKKGYKRGERVRPETSLNKLSPGSSLKYKALNVNELLLEKVRRGAIGIS